MRSDRDAEKIGETGGYAGTKGGKGDQFICLCDVYYRDCDHFLILPAQKKRQDGDGYRRLDRDREAYGEGSRVRLSGDAD